MSQSKNKYTIFRKARKARKNKKTKRKKGGAASRNQTQDNQTQENQTLKLNHITNELYEDVVRNIGELEETFGIMFDNNNPDVGSSTTSSTTRPTTSKPYSTNIEDYDKMSLVPGTTTTYLYGNPQRLAIEAAKRYKLIKDRFMVLMNQKKNQEKMNQYEEDMCIDKAGNDMVDEMRTAFGEAGLKSNFIRMQNNLKRMRDDLNYMERNAKIQNLGSFESRYDSSSVGKTKKRKRKGKGKGKGKGKEKGKGKGKGKKKTKGKK